MQAAAMSNLKQAYVELGGKSPLIIFDDADLDVATDLALMGVLYNKVRRCTFSSGNVKMKTFTYKNHANILIFPLFQGEICVAGSRVYVQEGIYGEFEKKLVEKAKTWTVGDPFDPNVHYGPQVDK